MEQSVRYSLGARWIHSMLGTPVENHWINITEGQVDSVSATPAHPFTQYLGEQSIILPAGINAHAHLELSQLASPLDVPSRSMSGWVASLLAFRRSAEYNAGEGIRQAFCRREFLESTLAAADIVPNDIVPHECRECSRLPSPMPQPQWLPFAELLAWREDAAKTLNYGINEAGIEEAGAQIKLFGLSPHAPHTVCPALLERALEQHVPLAMHLAETRDERQLLRHHTGPLLEMMRRADPDYNPKSVLLGKRPMDYLRLLSAAPSAFIVHGNYLDDEELRFLAAHRETMSVIYCPRSHAYFRHSSYPLRKMLDYGVRVLLGTDSLASVPNLSLVEEMQFAVKRHPAISPEILYRLGTIEGATAFHLLQEGLGIIRQGTPARFAVIR